MYIMDIHYVKNHQGGWHGGHGENVGHKNDDNYWQWMTLNDNE